MGVTAAAKAASKVAIIMKADIAHVWIYNRPGDGVGKHLRRRICGLSHRNVTNHIKMYQGQLVHNYVTCHIYLCDK